MMDWINPAFAWGSLATALIVGCAVGAYLFPPFRRHAVAAALAIAGVFALYRKGVKDGSKHTQDKWDDAEKKSVDRGNKAHADAKRDVTSGRVRDKFDRDDL